MLNNQALHQAEIRLTESGPDLKHINAPEAIRELGHSDISIASNVLIIEQGCFAIWRYKEAPVYIAETINYRHLFEMAPARPNIQFLSSNASHISGDLASLIDPWSKSFYHWFEQLFRAFMLEESGFCGKYLVEEIGDFRVESLEMLGIEKNRIIFVSDQNFVVDKLWVTDRSRVDFMRYRPKLFWKFRDKMLSNCERTPPAERILLVRSKNVYNPRGVVNENEILEIAGEYGYRVFDFGTISFRTQVSISSRARSMIGAHGANFCHIMFMDRYQHVAEFFSPLYINYSAMPFVEHLNHFYFALPSQTTEDYVHGHDSLVDPYLLKSTLRSIEHLLSRNLRSSQTRTLSLPIFKSLRWSARKNIKKNSV